MSGTETGEVDPDDVHDRITQAYLGELGTRFMENTRRRIHWICGQVRGRRVLDIGCSQGIICILLAREGREVTGIDRDPKAIAEARDYLAAEPPEVRDRIRFIEGDAADMPVEEPFDTVILGEILEHLEDPAWLIDAAARQTAAEGRLVVTVPFGINDFIDHKQTFYLSGPHALISRRFDVADVEMLGKWIGFRADKLARSGAVPKRPLGVESLPFLEEGFQRFERILLNEKDAVKERLRRSEDMLGDAQTQIGQLKRRLRVAGEERDSYKTQTGQLKRRLRVAEEERDAALEDVKARSRALEAEILRRTKQAEIRAGTIRDLRREVKEVRDTTSFRLGHSIVLGVKSPRRMLKLPATAWRLWREGVTGIRSASSSDPEISLEDLLRIHTARGTDGVCEEIKARTRTGRRAATAMIKAGKALAEAGFAEAEMPLALEAVQIDGSESNLRALYWVAQRTGDFATAKECLERTERIYGPNPRPAQAAMLEKLRKGPAIQLSILDQVLPEGPRAFEPIRGRLVYALHNSLPWSSGGYATRAHGMALGMEAAGLEVICLTRPGFPLDIKPDIDPGTLPLEDVIEGIAYRRIPSPARAGMPVQDYMLAAADAMTAELERLRPEWVIAASNHVTGIPALIAARRLGIPFVYEVRGFWEVTRLSREPAFRGKAAFRVQELLEGGAARRADHVFTLTGPMRDELVRRGVDRETVTLLPNSVDPDRFSPRGRDADLAARLDIPADVPVIGYIGTFVQYEGLDDLVAACALLRARGRTFRLMLVGNENASGQDKGPITETIERTAAESDLTDWLIMPGRVPHEKVEAYYSLIDIAPFPRKPQPVTEMVSPMKPLEALAMEKAVVVSSVRALTEMIADGETGLVFAKGSVESLAYTLDRLIGDADLRARLARAGRAWVARERTWTEMGARAAERLAMLGDAKSAGEAATSPARPETAKPRERADAVKG
jgi:glycosyltransferase involved in cell wall biosynthesis/SAM-dependent methyltransferase